MVARRMSSELAQIPLPAFPNNLLGYGRPERANFGSPPGGRSAELCARRPVFIGDFCALASWQRIFGAVKLAEGGEPGSNILPGCGKLTGVLHAFASMISNPNGSGQSIGNSRAVRFALAMPRA